MSIKLYLYTNLSDRRKAQKDLTLIAERDIELKGDCDVQRPVLIVGGDAAAFATVNYCYIPAFKRYYYCDCMSLPGGMVRLTCERDPLSSAWANGLKDCRAIIARQQEDFNLYLNDGTFQAYANDQVVTKEFSAGFGTPSYVLVVAG